MNTDAINNAIAPLQDTVKAIYLSVDDLFPLPHIAHAGDTRGWV